MALRVIVAGGGTAGHVYPGLAVAEALRSRGHAVSFVGTQGGLEATLVPAAGIDFQILDAAPFARRSSVAAARAAAIALRGTSRCRDVVQGADVVIGMGGYVSVPAVLAARLEHVPVVVHEQNAVPGLANRVLSRIARRIATSFAEAIPLLPRHVRPRAVVTGNPVRREIVRIPEERDALAKEARREFELDDDRRTVLIFGGSQGAVHIDRAAAGACRLLRTRADLQILLITGPAHLGAIRRGIPDDGSILVRALGYVDRMDLAYACADLVVSRAGATTVAELTVCGLPGLLVPYPYATGRHQEANARALQRAGAATVVLDEHLSGEVLAVRIESLIDHDERLRAMAERSAGLGRADAAGRVADLAIEVTDG
ncbi:MAG TPA: undecaprenyldiphospho-muramoylpentapeptide beta-N-acetylglucosaminyltransferase [Actinomycetota bacterium]